MPPRVNKFYQGKVLIAVKTHIHAPVDPGAIPATVRQEFRAQLEVLAPRLPGSVAELRDALRPFYGSNKAVAQALGVTPRTLERYIATEQGKGSQKRGLSSERRVALGERMRELLAPHLRGNTVKALRLRGMRLSGTFTLAWSDETSTRNIQGHIPPSYFWGKNGIGAKLEQGALDEAAEMTALAFLASYDAGGAALEGVTDLTLLL